jgi:PhnB protein
MLYSVVDRESSPGEVGVTSTRSRVQPIPEEYSTVTPYVLAKGVGGLIDFLVQAFGARERFRVPNEDGTIGHAEVQLGNSVVMMFDAKAEWPDTPSFFTLWVDDCDAVHRAALDAGATVVTDLSTSAWGIRGSRIRDPLGNIWWIQTQVEDVSEEESVRRMGEEPYVTEMRESTETLDRELRALGAGRRSTS